ncbi:MAG: transcriptional regulator NrdR [Opitutales bacterium]|tara:strand:- start:3908 stop:4369 length:462 start_codon:yes stop_codon:yes gene_type:complete
MNCPQCDHNETKVIETRMGKDSSSIKRRRQCLQCEHRFNTLESIIREELLVLKRNGKKELFNREKILGGILMATEKCPVDIKQLKNLAEEVADSLESQYDSEIPSLKIGEAIMDRLKKIDQIAYVRFASVYKDFRNISEMAQEISSLTPPDNE